MFWLAFAIAILVSVFGWHLCRLRRPERRLQSLEQQIGKMKKMSGRNIAANEQILRRIYALIYKAMAAKDAAMVYRAADALKLAYGEGLLRSQEPEHLMTLLSYAVKSKNSDNVVRALDVYRVMLLRLPPESLVQAIDQLGLASSLVYRERLEFLVAKTAEITLDIMERSNMAKRPELTAAILRTLQLIGLFALRRRDHALFREIISRLTVAAMSALASEAGKTLFPVFAYWLNHMASANDRDGFILLSKNLDQLTQAGCVLPAAAEALIREWAKAAGVAALNPNSALAGAIIEEVLRLARTYWDMACWLPAVSGAADVARFSIERRGTQHAFSVFLPLLENGRKLLVDLLRLGPGVAPEAFREKALYIIMRECIAVMEMAGRQELSTTAGDMIAEYYQLWLSQPETRNAQISVQKFCQLMMLCWQQRKKRQTQESLPNGNLLFQPLRITEKDQQKLNFLRN